MGILSSVRQGIQRIFVTDKRLSMTVKFVGTLGYSFSKGGKLIDAGEDPLDDVVVGGRRMFAVGEVRQDGDVFA